MRVLYYSLDAKLEREDKNECLREGFTIVYNAVSDRHSTYTGLGQGRGTFTFGLRVLLHHRGREDVNSICSLLFKTKSDVCSVNGSMNSTF